jgi:hypothetical protein
MHDQAGAWTTYLVEHYRPGGTAEELARSAAVLRQTAAALQLEGKPLRFVASTIVPDDESLLCLLEARSERLVRDTYARAGIPYERVSTAITQASPTVSAPCTDPRSGPTLRPQERGESR